MELLGHGQAEEADDGGDQLAADDAAGLGERERRSGEDEGRAGGERRDEHRLVEQLAGGDQEDERDHSAEGGDRDEGGGRAGRCLAGEYGR